MGTGPTLQPPRRTSPRVRESRPDDAHALVTDEPSASPYRWDQDDFQG